MSAAETRGTFDEIRHGISAYQCVNVPVKRHRGESGHTHGSLNSHRLLVRSFPSDYVHTLVYCEFRGTHSAVDGGGGGGKLFAKLIADERDVQQHGTPTRAHDWDCTRFIDYPEYILNSM
jgi:hypothetical protein